VNIVFDLDGVLVDTREAVRQAYKDAGVIMPDDAWGKPWQSWLIEMCSDYRTAMLVHAEKDVQYKRLIEHNCVQLLPPMVLLRTLHQSGVVKVGVATGASESATGELTRRFHISDVPVYGTSMTPEAKALILPGVAPFGVYIDDHKVEIPGWRTIRYDPDVDGMDELMEKLWMP
jgi:phosphoglycolate phosphatase-like HAD superfamily hydrolase